MPRRKVRKGLEGRKREFFAKTVEAVLDRDNYACVYDGSYTEKITTVIPVSHGGVLREQNAVCICDDCYQKKPESLDEVWVLPALTYLFTKGVYLSWMNNRSKELTRLKASLKLTGICPVCKEEFIKNRSDQVYCKKNECQKKVSSFHDCPTCGARHRIKFTEAVS